MQVDMVHNKSCQSMGELDNDSIDIAMTSPPYWGLRDYGEDVKEIWGGDPDCKHEFESYVRPAGGGHANPDKAQVGTTKKDIQRIFGAKAAFCQKCGAWYGQLGLEPTLEMYIEHLLLITLECKRVLKPTGVMWWNHGDSYYNASKWTYKETGHSWDRERELVPRGRRQGKAGAMPEKCLALQNYRLVIRMIDEQGWILRNNAIWNKPNGMPSSVKDRLANKYEPVFCLVKNTKPQYCWNEKTGLMADRKPPEAEQKEGIDWHWVEIGEDYSQSDTKISPQEAEKFNSPRARVHRQKKRKKRTFWHSLGYWYDLDAIREPHTLPLRQRGKKSPAKETGWNHQFEGSKINYNPAGKNPGDVWKIPTQPRPEAHFACVSSLTECLTLEGWKYWYQLKRGEKIASYNLEKQLIEYQSLSSIKTYNYDAELIKVGNRDLDILMTHNHRNIVSKRLSTGRKETIVRADELAYMDKIRVRAPVDYPENQGIGMSLASLLGWIISEGHFKKQGGIELYQNKGEGEKAIDAILIDLDVPHSKKINGREIVWYIPKSYCRILKSICPEKKLSQFLISLPLAEAQSLFSALVAGDGHTRKNDGRIVFIQKDKETIDWFSILALRLGYHNIISKDKNRDLYRVYLTNRTHIGIHSARAGKTIVNQYYHGKIWCPSVPNGTWVARRNGRMFITGNTFPDKLCLKPILATCPAEICRKCGKARVRITKVIGREVTEAMKIAGCDKDGMYHGTEQKDYQNTKAQKPSESKKNILKSMSQVKNTIGWTDCGCNAGFDSGILLDPFAGRGTSLIMAKKLGRHYVGYELKKEYADMAERELEKIDPLFRRR